MTPWRCHWRDVTIASRVMTLRFEQLHVRTLKWENLSPVKAREKNYHYISKGTRDFHPCVHGLRHPWDGKPRCELLIWTLGWDSLVSSNVAINSIILPSQHLTVSNCAEDWLTWLGILYTFALIPCSRSSNTLLLCWQDATITSVAFV